MLVEYEDWLEEFGLEDLFELVVYCFSGGWKWFVVLVVLFE